jgi:hypothetical protein
VESDTQRVEPLYPEGFREALEPLLTASAELSGRLGRNEIGIDEFVAGKNSIAAQISSLRLQYGLDQPEIRNVLPTDFISPDNSALSA